MSRTALFVLFLVLALCFAPAALAQSDQGQGDKPDPQTPPAAPPAEGGVQSGGYVIHQSIELGARIVGTSGNEDVYSTFVNIGDGPRLLEYSLSMHALPNTGLLFDDLSFSNFGYGGDPNNISRLRVSKTRWYDFRGLFRRDRNFWDFNLLANPFNPPVPDPTIFPADNVITFTPHRMELVRRMTDLDLTLLPQRDVSVRLGYSRNVMNGHSLSTYHEGPDVLVDQPWRTTSNRFRAGIDLNMLPRTRISFDQSFDWFKQDTTAALEFFRFGQLNDGSLNGFPLVELGVVLDPSGQPCAAPIANNAVTPVAINPTCGGYLDYGRSNPWRGTYPTSVLSFQSSYWNKVDLAGGFSYSGGQFDGPFGEAFYGRVSRTFHQRYMIDGDVDNNRVVVNADFGVTFHLTDRFRIIDKFNWNDFRLPGNFAMAELSQFSNSMAVEAVTYDPVACAPPFGNPAACPLYGGSPANSGSPADVIIENFNHYFGQDALSNLVEAQFDFGRRGGVSAGYRLRNREISVKSVVDAVLTYFPGRYANAPGVVTAARGECRAGNVHGALPDPLTGVCTVAFTEGLDAGGLPELHQVDITENAFVAGVWFRPIDALRISYDLDWMEADDIFTRITPETSRQHKVRVMVKPRRWFNLTGTVNILDMESNVPSEATLPAEPDAGIDFNLDTRSYGFVATFFDQDNYSLDLSYNYSTYESNTSFCFIDTDPPPGVAPDALRCGTATGMQFGTSFWDNRIHFGSFNLNFRPTERVNAMLGYTVTSSNADALQTNPFGTPLLGVNYHLPSAMISYKFSDRWMVKAGFNHYGYNEKFDPGRTLLRDFRANVGTLAVRYEF